MYGETLFNNRRGVNPLSRRHALSGPALHVLAKIQPRSFPTADQHLIVLIASLRKPTCCILQTYKPVPMAPLDRSFFNPDLHRKYGDVVGEAIKE